MTAKQLPPESAWGVADDEIAGMTRARDEETDDDTRDVRVVEMIIRVMCALLRR